MSDFKSSMKRAFAIRDKNRKMAYRVFGIWPVYEDENPDKPQGYTFGIIPYFGNHTNPETGEPEWKASGTEIIVGGLVFVVIIAASKLL